MEQLYSIRELSTEQLREIYSTYKKYGWIDFDYYELVPENVKRPELSDAEIVLNINADNEENYLVYMINHEDEEDGVMIGFGLSYYLDFGVYLHLPPKVLTELIEKYSLTVSSEVRDSTVEEFLVSQIKKEFLN